MNRLPTLTPHLEDQSTTYDADRRSDPTPNNTPNQLTAYESRDNLLGNLEGSVRSWARWRLERERARDLIEAGLNEAAVVLALW